MHKKIALAILTTLFQLSPAAQILPNLQCGKDNKNAVCPKGMCCSDAGWCGTTEAFCSVPSNCQEAFGRCDSDVSPDGLSMAGGQRQWNNNLPELITHCTRERTLALSFDDGPSHHTHEVLDVLQEFGARATFFLGGILNGRGAIDTEWKSIIQRMVQEGHQVASHTWSHPDLDSLSSKARIEEMHKNERAIANVIGKIPTFMRPPRIICNQECQKDMKNLGYHVVTWQYDSTDWQTPHPSAQQQADQLLQEMSKVAEDSNMFIIQHDIHSDTAEVVRSILEAMKSSWKAVPLVECLNHSLDDAYQFPQSLEYAASEDGCVASGPGMCVKPQTFNTWISCMDAVAKLRTAAGRCLTMDQGTYIHDTRGHCFHAAEVARKLDDYCDKDCSTVQNSCSHKDFIQKGKGFMVHNVVHGH